MTIMAAPQPAASRKKPSVTAGSDDQFAARAIEFTDWARTNIRLIVGSVVALAIVVGGLLFFGPMVVAFVSAWRAGIRPPGFSRNASFFEIQLGVMIFGSLTSAVLWGVAEALAPGSGPALAVRGVSIIVGFIA
ncbi:MAG: hypothetical protein KY464_02650, partial [Gemmatimonadetes bacterium]|nr:hypothetical protein [Gemmatimonadota bacterium]